MIRVACLVLWALAGPAVAQQEDIAAQVFAALARAEAAFAASDEEAGRAALAKADALARRPEAAGTPAYWAPTVLQAERLAEARDFDEAWRFAEAAATGLNQPPYAAMELEDLRARTALVQGRVSVETRDMVAAADYLASALDGPLEPGAVLRARALRALALGFLDDTRTGAAFDALGPMSDRREALHALLGDADYLLLIYQWIDLLRSYEDPPLGRIAVWGGEMILRLDAGAGAVDPYSEAFYRAEAGLALSQAGRQAEAEPQLARAVEILMADWPDSQNAWRARYYEAYNFYTGGETDKAAAALAAMVADDGPQADAESLSLALQGQAVMAGPGPLAQALFRRSYEVALRGFDRDSVPVQRAAGFIDPADPGFAGWAYAADIRPQIAAEALDGQGTAILRAYLAGDHHVFDPILAEAEARLTPDKAAVNVALAAALRGEPEEALTRLAALRGGGARVAPGLLDRIEILALLWGSQHRVAEAGPAIDRLARAEPGSLMVPVARAYKAMLEEDWAVRDAALADWAARFDPDPEPGPWDVMAALMIAEVGGAKGEVPEGRAIIARAQDLVARTEGLTLAQDFVAFAPYLVPRTGARADEGLDDAIALIAGLREAFPPDTAIATTLPVTQARYETERGNLDRAEALYLDAIAINMRAAHARPEILAMLRIELAVLLTRDDRLAEALPLVQQAEAALAQEEMPPSWRSGITGQVASVRLQLDGVDRALASLEAMMARPGFVDSLRPIDQAYLYSTLAQYRAQSAQPEAARESLERSARALEAHEGADPSDRAQLAYGRSIVNWWIGDVETAFAEMTRSNDMYFEIRSRIARESPGGVAKPLPMDRERAMAEVALGWALASEPD